MAPTLRKKARISYYEPDEPNLDEYVFCMECADFVYEYCSIHGPLLVIPDDKVAAAAPRVPRSALTIPRVFLHLARSRIPGAGIGVFSSLTLPSGVRFGPYRGAKSYDITSPYCWQIYSAARRAAHVLDAADPARSNWMRYVNCSRAAAEQNLLAYQYRGEIYYRTIKIIPRFTELLVYYGTEYARELGIDVRRYNAHRSGGGSGPALEKHQHENGIYSKSTDQTDIQHHMKIKEFEPKLEEKTVCCTEVGSNNHVTLSTNYLSQEGNQTKMNCSSEFHIKKTTNSGDITNETKLCDESSNVSITPVTNRITCNVKQYKCNIWDKSFTKSSDLVTHKRTHTGEKPYKCDVCEKAFTDSGHLVRHKRTHTGEKPYKCDVCDKAFTESGTLVTHKRTHTGGKPYKCDVCDEAFTVSGALVRHKRTHTGEKPYKCDVCDKAFTVSSTLVTHKRTHTGEKPYKCDVCEKAFTDSGHLVRHKRTHTGEKPYKCDVCDKAFTESGTLVTHKRTHTGGKPYKCDVCDEAFTVSGALVRHKRTHTGEKPYKCDVCDKAFTVSSTLVTHKRTHTGEKPYKCDVCDKAFTESGTLVTHKRTHTGGKPYKCDLCDEAFTVSGALVRHKRTHTGEKPYKCDVCDEAFTQSGNLVIHKLTHTGIVT